MVHIIVSFAFMLIALGAAFTILQTLAEGRTKILLALGLIEKPTLVASLRPARVRPAGHWQATPASLLKRRAVA